MAQATTHVYWTGSLAGQTADEWTDLAEMAMSEGDKALYKPEKIVKINVQDDALQLYQSDQVIFIAGSK